MSRNGVLTTLVISLGFCGVLLLGAAGNVMVASSEIHVDLPRTHFIVYPHGGELSLQDIAWFQEQAEHAADIAIVGREAETMPLHISYHGVGGDYTPKQTFLEVSPNFFRIAGLMLQAGRLLTPDDAQQSGRMAVVAADAVPPGEWQRQHGDHYHLGETVLLGTPLTRDSFTVVGVLEPYVEKSFSQYHRPDDYNNIIYVPIGKAPAIGSHPGGESFAFREPPVDDYWLLVQPKPGELPAARHEATTLLTARTGFPPRIEDADYRQLVIRHTETAGLQSVGHLQTVAALLSAAILFVLATARSITETRQLALQRALGATGSQVAEWFAGQVFVHFLVGGALGMVLGLWLAPELGNWIGLPIRLSASQVLGYGEAFSAVSVVALAIPVRRIVQLSPALALRGELRRGWGANSWVLRRRLIVALLVTSMLAALSSLDSATGARTTLRAYLDAAGAHTLLVSDILQRPAVLEQLQTTLADEGYVTNRVDVGKALVQEQLLDVVGTGPDYYQLRHIELAQGRLPRTTADDAVEAVVGAGLVSELRLGTTLTVNGHTVHVVGSFEAAATGVVDYFYDRDTAIFLTLDGLNRLGSLPAPSQCQLLVDAPDTSPQALSTKLAASGVDLTGVRVDFLSGSIPELLQWAERYDRYLTTFLFLFMAVLVAAWATTLAFELPERRYELVLSRALGATRRRLFWAAFLEGVRTTVLSLLGSVVILAAYRLATEGSLTPFIHRLPATWVVLVAFLLPLLVVQGLAALSAVRIGDGITQFREV